MPAAGASERVAPKDLEILQAEGSLVVDVGLERQRAEEGGLGFGCIVKSIFWSGGSISRVIIPCRAYRTTSST